MNLREFRSTDLEACLDIFDSNVPQYFAPVERDEFAQFLREMPCPYFVMTDEGESVVACGGFDVDAQARIASLCWGMVARERHRGGLGQRLLEARIAQVERVGNVDRVMIETSQHTAPFYERFQFVVAEIERDGFGPGLHRVVMVRTI